MAEEKETTSRRKKRSSGEHAPAAQNQNLKAGELLRQTRIAKGLELEEISSAIHVRVGQLKAIEENHLDQLPGMTYALGFIKSYATYLKLDAVEIANKFKAENGAVTQPKPAMQHHEPLAESKMPDPFILAAAGAGVLIVGLVWYIFSGGDESAREIASAIPPAPAIVEPVAAPAAEPAAVTSADDDAPEPIATGPLTSPVTPVRNAVLQETPAPVPAQPLAATTTALPRQKPNTGAPAETAVAPAAGQAVAKPVASPVAAAPPEEPQINIKPGRGRVALRATQTSWVQVTDGNKNVVFKKVLQPGETYYVPEGNYSLITSNAGGIDAYVDGNKVRTLGGQGDIVRGMKLQPEILQRNRPRKSNFRE